MKYTLDQKGANQQLQEHKQHRMKTTVEANNKLPSFLNHSTKFLVEKKQLEMLERLDKTIEKLNNKVVSVERKQEESSIYPRHNSDISNDNDLNTKVKHIQNSTAEKHSTPSLKKHLDKNDEYKSSSLLHQSSLVKNLENKLGDLEARLDNNNSKDKRCGKHRLYSPLPGTPTSSFTKYIERYLLHKSFKFESSFI